MIEYKKLVKEDIDQIVALEEKYLNDSLGKDMLEKGINSNTLDFVVAKEDKKVLGYISGYFILDEGEILNFVVDEAYQRKGIGTILFNMLLDNHKDAKKIVLEVRYNNLKGLNFYKKNKFIEVTKRKHYYKNGDDAIVMMKEII